MLDIQLAKQMTTTDARVQMYTVNEKGTVHMNKRPFDRRAAQRNTRYDRISHRSISTLILDQSS